MLGALSFFMNFYSFTIDISLFIAYIYTIPFGERRIVYTTLYHLVSRYRRVLFSAITKTFKNKEAIIMKKITCLILALLMCFLTAIPVFAAESPTIFSSSLPEMKGILTDEDGTQYTIIGTQVPTVQAADTNSGCSVTYMFDIPASILANYTNTTQGNDGAFASTVYLTLTYSTKNSPTEYLLTKVSGHWTIQDSSVSVESATLSYGCNGMAPVATNNQYCWDKSVSNYFNVSTGFTNYVTALPQGVLGAYLKVNYLMGSSRRWSFTLYNYLFNNVVTS